MKTKEKSITKICSFYANEWHLTTMILPYILKMLENGYEIETILENNLKEHMEELISKLNIKDETKKQILNIKWDRKEIDEIKNINNNKSIVLVEGNMDRINHVNNYIENNIKNDISIINCYHVSQIEENISQILGSHDLILNTSGNHKINESLNP